MAYKYKTPEIPPGLKIVYMSQRLNQRGLWITFYKHKPKRNPSTGLFLIWKCKQKCGWGRSTEGKTVPVVRSADTFATGYYALRSFVKGMYYSRTNPAGLQEKFDLWIINMQDPVWLHFMNNLSVFSEYM